MSTAEIVRAWTDKEYRNSLTPEQLASLPENPAGNAEELVDYELANLSNATPQTVWLNCDSSTTRSACTYSGPGCRG